MLSQTDAPRDLRPAPLATFMAAWDCHVHVFGPRDRYPLQARPRYLPGVATPQELIAHLERTGARSAVLIQASPYGADNACILDALAALGDAHRAVVSLIPDTVSDQLMTQFSAVGVRGVRVNPDAWGSDMIERCLRFAQRLAGTSWHLEVNCPINISRRLAETCKDSAPLVFDHLAGADPSHPEFETHMTAMADILRDQNWIKISGLDRVRNSESDSDRLTQTISMIQKLAPDRVIWGSDWPHTPLADGATSFRAVDINAELSWILERLADDAERVMCINPRRLYF